MKIINAHVHLIQLDEMIRRMGHMQLPAVSVLKDVKAFAPMLNPETLIAQMDDAGVETSVLYAVQAPIVYSSNEYVRGLCDRFPGRFIGFASVDPKSPDAPAVLEAAVRDLGLQGLKLHPPLQDFFPDDPAVFGVYQKCVDLNIPVVFHVGTTPFGALCHLSQASPMLIDEVAIRFPTLRILLTHLGTLWHNEAFMVVEKNPNVFIDTAAYITEIESVLTSDILTRIGPDKVVFGTDYPMPYAGKAHSIKEFVDCIKGLGFADDVLEGIFSGNFQRLLHGGPETPMIDLAEIAKLAGLMPTDPPRVDGRR